MALSCPKCASIEVQRLSQVYESDRAALAKVAAPPARKQWILWAALAALCVVPFLLHLREPGPVTVITTGLAGLWTGFALNAWSYNARLRPALLERWQQSFMCSRCGEVFSAP
jgi:hypothetical protein